MSVTKLEDLFGGAVTVGERGQVVIPAKTRERMGIRPGDKLLVFAHPQGMGVLFMRLEKAIEAQREVTNVLSRVLELDLSESSDSDEGGDT